MNSWIALAASLALASCQAHPTRSEVEAADRGPMPDAATAEAAARWVLSNVLRDGENSRIECEPPPRAGYRRDGSGWAYCWILEAEVTDFGAGLHGKRNLVYEFYFRHDRIEAFTSDYHEDEAPTLVQLVIGAPPLEHFRRGETPEWRTLKDVLDEF